MLRQFPDNRPFMTVIHFLPSTGPGIYHIRQFQIGTYVIGILRICEGIGGIRRRLTVGLVVSVHIHGGSAAKGKAVHGIQILREEFHYQPGMGVDSISIFVGTGPLHTCDAFIQNQEDPQIAKVAVIHLRTAGAAFDIIPPDQLQELIAVGQRFIDRHTPAAAIVIGAAHEKQAVVFLRIKKLYILHPKQLIDFLPVFIGEHMGAAIGNSIQPVCQVFIFNHPVAIRFPGAGFSFRSNDHRVIHIAEEHRHTVRAIQIHQRPGIVPERVMLPGGLSGNNFLLLDCIQKGNQDIKSVSFDGIEVNSIFIGIGPGFSDIRGFYRAGPGIRAYLNCRIGFRQPVEPGYIACGIQNVLVDGVHIGKSDTLSKIHRAVFLSEQQIKFCAVGSFLRGHGKNPGILAFLPGLSLLQSPEPLIKIQIRQPNFLKFAKIHPVHALFPDSQGIFPCDLELRRFFLGHVVGYCGIPVYHLFHPVSGSFFLNRIRQEAYRGKNQYSNGKHNDPKSRLLIIQHSLHPFFHTHLAEGQRAGGDHTTVHTAI